MRSAEAFGADGSSVLPGTVSAVESKGGAGVGGKCVSDAGACDEAEEMLWNAARGGRAGSGRRRCRGHEPADLVDLAEPVALLIGNEGNGVPVDLAAKADGAMTIPCPGPVESLNAAVAASVLLYEAARQRAAKSGGPPDRRGGSR